MTDSSPPSRLAEDESAPLRVEAARRVETAVAELAAHGVRLVGFFTVPADPNVGGYLSPQEPLPTTAAMQLRVVEGLVIEACMLIGKGGPREWEGGLEAMAARILDLVRLFRESDEQRRAREELLRLAEAWEG